MESEKKVRRTYYVRNTIRGDWCLGSDRDPNKFIPEDTELGQYIIALSKIIGPDPHPELSSRFSADFELPEEIEAVIRSWEDWQ